MVGHYKYPCILDLKMGTEKHKDYVVSQEEADRRQARWDQTTSKSLGVRVSGMKVSFLLLLNVRVTPQKYSIVWLRRYIENIKINGICLITDMLSKKLCAQIYSVIIRL